MSTIERQQVLRRIRHTTILALAFVVACKGGIGGKCGADGDCRDNLACLSGACTTLDAKANAAEVQKRAATVERARTFIKERFHMSSEAAARSA